MLNSKEMDAQSPVKIDKWIEADSEESKKMDQHPGFLKKLIRLEVCETDDLGRLWTNGSGQHFPIHDEYNGKLIGYRISKSR